MKFELLIGSAAMQWLSIDENREAWDLLQARCAWSTPYLSSKFAYSWYQHYSTVWAPLIITWTDVEGVLNGLTALARARNGREIVGAGAHQSEYQGWLCTSEQMGAFLDGVCESLFQYCPECHLRLRYVDLANDDERLLRWAERKNNVVLDVHRRPLIEANDEAIRAVLNKRGNRSKLNRLKRAGELRISNNSLEVATAAQLDEIIPMYDFRQGAANDSCPFFDDEFKRAFHLDLMGQMPEQIVFFSMLLDGRPVAAFLGIRGPRRVSNAILAYTPQFSRHSPGKLLMYLAAESMASKGVAYVDLTPGGDPWKERFATLHDEVYELNVWRRVARARNYRRKRQLQNAARSALIRVGLSPAAMRATLARLRRLRLSSVSRAVRSMLPKSIEYRVYRLHLDDLAESSSTSSSVGEAPNIDELADLVRFDSTATWQGRQQFLAEAMDRIERGEQFFTYADKDSLLHYGWLIRQQNEAFFSEVESQYKYPEPGAVLYDFFTHPAARGRRLYQRTLAAMLQHLDLQSVRDGGPRIVYISVLADNNVSRHVIEKMGFSYLESIVRETAYGRSRCRQVVG